LKGTDLAGATGSLPGPLPIERTVSADPRALYGFSDRSGKERVALESYPRYDGRLVAANYDMRARDGPYPERRRGGRQGRGYLL
jgi:hypothetical protein